MAGTPTPPFNVLTTTATELETLHEGSLTSVQIIETYLAQIEKHNHAGAKLNAMITVAPRKLVLKASWGIGSGEEGGDDKRVVSWLAYYCKSV
jgi:amidase